MPTATVVKKEAAREPDPPPRIQPTGRVRKGGHGLQSGPSVKLAGRERLRALMGLSANVSLDNVCEDAAAEIESLRIVVAQRR